MERPYELGFYQEGALEDKIGVCTADGCIASTQQTTDQCRISWYLGPNNHVKCGSKQVLAVKGDMLPCDDVTRLCPTWFGQGGLSSG